MSQHVDKYDLEGSGSHQNKGEGERSLGQSQQAGHPPSPFNQLGASSRIVDKPTLRLNLFR